MRMGMVVPTLGRRPALLRECLDSLVRQTPVEQDIVIVTTEDEVEKVSRFSDGLPVLAQEGKGIPAAITTGWKHLGDTVDALGWLGDDDRLPDGSLASALTALERSPRTSMVYGQVRFIRFNGQALYVKRPSPLAQLLMRMDYNAIVQPGCVYRRTAVEAVGGLDCSFRLAFDTDLHRRLIAHSPAGYVASVLGEIRLHDDSLSIRCQEESSRECRRALRQQMPCLLRWSSPVWGRAVRFSLSRAAKIYNPVKKPVNVSAS